MQEKMQEKESRKSFLNIMWGKARESKGDKVVWMILILLIMCSMLAVFSSSSQLAAQGGTTRLHLFAKHLIFIAAGLVIVGICYIFGTVERFRKMSKYGFLISLVFIVPCTFHFWPAATVNGAWRIWKVFGVQIFVAEICKVFMPLYLGWAVTALKNNEFSFLPKLYDAFPSLSKGFSLRTAELLFYIFIPMIIVCIGLVAGSGSSMIFIGGIMVIIILIGGIKLKELILPFILGVATIALCFGVYNISDGKYFSRFGTMISRMGMHEKEQRFEELSHKRDSLTYIINSPEESDSRKKMAKTSFNETSAEYKDLVDILRQKEGAKMAIKQGGIFGKGAGRSTMKYVVPIIYGDYMFSFIIEEYGLLGGIFIVILYVMLLARCALIARRCEDGFAKMVIAGLGIMISSQAMMHMYVNIDIGPHTGQTLPLISHGTSALLMFSLAFGVILSISKVAKEAMDEKEAQEAINDEQEDQE